MEIRLLGPVELRIDGEPVALGGVKQRAVLSLLALNAPGTVTADRISEALWGEHAPPSAPKMIQLYVSQLRKLGVDIATRGRGYALSADVDAVRFEDLVRRAGRGEPVVSDALALWRGEPLSEVAGEPFAAEEIRRLEELWLQARELANDEALAAGEHAGLVSELDALVAAHPLRERLQAQRMLALYRSGRQADALGAFRSARATLLDQIGIEPGPELRGLNDRILDQDPALAAPPPARARLTVASHSRRWILVAALAVAAAGIAVFAITRTGPDSLGHIDGGTVGLIDLGSGRITAQYAVGHEPAAIASGAGSVWVANHGDGTVSRIDDDQVTTIDVAGVPTSLAFGAGSLWVTDELQRKLIQINPATNRIARRVTVGNGPRGVAVGAGAVWVTSAIDDRVDRLDLASGAMTSVTVTGGPAALAVSGDGVWVAALDTGVLARLEPRTGALLKTIAVGGGPAAVAVGAGGVWVANRSDGTVSRVDPATNAVSATVRVGGRPEALAIGGDRVWVGDAAGGAVVAVSGSRVVRRTAIAGSPAALVVEAGSVWTAALAPTASHRGGTLRYRSGPPEFCHCLDPAGNDSRITALTSPVYDGLVAYRHVGGSAGSTLTPDLAASLPAPGDGGRSYVFQLRPGLRFSDGRPVRPADVRASLERAVRLLGPPAPPYYGAIVGADACTPARCDLARGILTDEQARTVTLKLSRPDPELLHKLALQFAAVVPADTPVRIGRTPPIGTGPYRVDGFDPAHGGRLVRNRHFTSWSADARPDGFPDVVEFGFSRDLKAEVDSVRKGRADVAPLSDAAGAALPIADLRALELADAPHIHSSALAGTDWLFLNTTAAPFDDARVRRAFNFAIDRRRVLELYGGPALASITCQIVPPGLPGYAPTCPYTRRPIAAGVWSGPDLARARALVNASGTAGAHVTVWTFGGSYQAEADYAAGVLRRLGFKARVKVQPAIGRYFATVGDSRNAVQIGVGGWTADTLTPSSFFGPNFTCFLRVPRSSDNLNLSQFCDPAVDRGFNAAVSAADPDSARDWERVDRRVVAAAATAPLVNRRAALLVSDRVGNVQQHLAYGPLLDQLWVR